MSVWKGCRSSRLGARDVLVTVEIAKTMIQQASGTRNLEPRNLGELSSRMAVQSTNEQIPTAGNATLSIRSRRVGYSLGTIALQITTISSR